MKPLFLFPFIGLFASAFLPAFLLACDSEHGHEHEAKIIGGKPSPPDAYPWMGALARTSGKGDLFQRQFCGATLVHPSWAITAAHCVENSRPGAVELWFGINNLDQSEKAIRRDVVGIYLHSGYREDFWGNIFNDIAFLQLSEPVEGIEPLPYARRGRAAPVGTSVRAIGWGSKRRFGSFPKELREIDLRIFPLPKARRLFETKALGPGHLPALRRGRDTCLGDSGGPLFLPGDGGLLVGITSYGIGCNEGFPGIYTNMGHYSSLADRFLAAPLAGEQAPSLGITGRNRTIRAGTRSLSRGNGTLLGKGKSIRPGAKVRQRFRLSNPAGSTPLSVVRVRSSSRDFRVARRPTYVFGGGRKSLVLEFDAPKTRVFRRSSISVTTNTPGRATYRFRVGARAGG